MANLKIVHGLLTVLTIMHWLVLNLILELELILVLVLELILVLALILIEECWTIWWGVLALRYPYKLRHRWMCRLADSFTFHRNWFRSWLSLELYICRMNLWIRMCIQLCICFSSLWEAGNSYSFRACLRNWNYFCWLLANFFWRVPQSRIEHQLQNSRDRWEWPHHPH